jgi:serine/threonine protein kinase/predicted esterase
MTSPQHDEQNHESILVDQWFQRLVSLADTERQELLRTAQLPESVRVELQALLAVDNQFGHQTDLFSAVSQLNVAGMLPPSLSCFSMLGKRLGPHRIVEVIGQGGFGTVYKAVREGAYKEVVAIKILRSDRQSRGSLVKRFEQERQMLAELQHKNISRILDGGQTDDETPYFVMEYIDGLFITDYCNERQLTIHERIRLFREVCCAVAYAHQQGIVHRDLKPSNILVCHDGTPKLLDFGIAKVMCPHRRPVDDLTETGVLPATRSYASPEHLSGHVCTLASDVYSLGVILYELLVGVHPFLTSDCRLGTSDAIADPRVSTPYQTLVSLRDRKSRPNRPTVADRTEEAASDAILEIAWHRSTTVPSLLKQVRGDIANIVMTAIRKDPSRRYNSARDIADELDRCLEGRPVRACGDSIAYHVGRAIRRNVAHILVAILVLSQLILVPLGIAWHREALREAEETRRQVAEEVRREKKAREDTVPLIKVLHNRRKFFHGYYAALDALHTLPDHGELQELFDNMTEDVKVCSVPSGAEIWIRPSSDPEIAWKYVGKTPFQGRLPRAVLHWRFRIPGLRDVVVSRHVNHFSKRPIDLLANDQAPAGMIPVPGGSEALIYASAERVKIDAPYYLGKYEVTNAEFERFRAASGYLRSELWPRIERDGVEVTLAEAREQFQLFMDSTGQVGPSTWENGRYPAGHAAHPVSGVSWYEAMAYARFAESSLPTVYHWYAAADTMRLAAVVPNSNLLSAAAVPVGTFRGIGAHGTFDMAGNVREWTSTETEDGQRYLLGGMWSDQPYMFNEPVARPPLDRSPGNGIRCVRYTEPVAQQLTVSRHLTVRDFSRIEPCSDIEFEQFIVPTFADTERPLEVVIKSDSTRFGYRCLELSFLSAYDDKTRVTAYLYLPDQGKFAPPYQTIIHFPGGYATMQEEMEGPWPDAYLAMGRAILCPTYFGTYERRDPSFNTPQPRQSREYDESIQKIVLDYRRAIDAVEQFPDLLDAERLAYFGYSWGAALGPLLLALDDRCQAAVLVCGGTPQTTANPLTETTNFYSRVQTPCLMLNCENDGIFPEAAQLHLYHSLPLAEGQQKLRRTYQVDTGHMVPAAGLIDEATQWFNRWMGRPKSAQPPNYTSAAD